MWHAYCLCLMYPAFVGKDQIFINSPKSQKKLKTFWEKYLR